MNASNNKNKLKTQLESNKEKPKLHYCTWKSCCGKHLLVKKNIHSSTLYGEKHDLLAKIIKCDKDERIY